MCVTKTIDINKLIIEFIYPLILLKSYLHYSILHICYQPLTDKSHRKDTLIVGNTLQASSRLVSHALAKDGCY